MRYVYAVIALVVGIPVILNVLGMIDLPYKAGEWGIGKANPARAPAWAGVWVEKTNSALLRIRYNGQAVTGEYAAADWKVAIALEQGRMERGMVCFNLRMQGALWHCVLEWDGSQAVLTGRRNMNALFETYVKEKEKRQEMKKAAEPVILGVFEKVEA